MSLLFFWLKLGNIYIYILKLDTKTNILMGDLTSPLNPSPPPCPVENFGAIFHVDLGKILLWGHLNLNSPT